MNIHSYIGNLFTKSDGSPIAEIAVSTSFGDIYTLEISSYDEADRAFIEKSLKALHFAPTYSNAEIASQGMLQYTNDPAVVEISNMELLLDDDSAETEEASEENDESVTENFSIDGNRQRLRILRDPENKKLADKIYAGLLGNTEDFSSYPAFLFEFDTFLYSHRPELEDQARNNVEGDDDDAMEFNDRPKNLKSLRGTKEKASVDDPLLNVIQLTNFAIEFAKEKSSRSAVLSSLMKHMSGSAGASVISAWENGDVDKMAEAFGELVGKVMEDMPIEEEENEEETSEEDTEEDTSDEDESSDENESSEEEETSDENEEDTSDEDNSSKDSEDEKSKDEDTKEPTTGFVGVEDLDAK